jgi:hypothetical protein
MDGFTDWEKYDNMGLELAWVDGRFDAWNWLECSAERQYSLPLALSSERRATATSQ